MAGEEQLRSQYLEAIRLFLWYSGSKFSFHQGKTSKELSHRYRNLFQELFTKYRESQT